MGQEGPLVVCTVLHCTVRREARYGSASCWAPAGVLTRLLTRSFARLARCACPSDQLL